LSRTHAPLAFAALPRLPIAEMFIFAGLIYAHYARA
jgi:hypothetical protein